MSQYASKADLQNTGLPAAALASPVTDPIIDAHLQQASAMFDSYARSRHEVPLSGALGPPNTYAPEVVSAVVKVAAYTLLVWRGFNPDDFDQSFERRHDQAIQWMRDVGAGKANLAVTADATPATREGAPRIYSPATSGRGWDDGTWFGDDA